jgi:hypothetical protein
MGLFDFGGGFGGGEGFAGGAFGGGFDMDQLLQMINPMPPAQAAPAIIPPPPVTDLMNPTGVNMDAQKLRNSPAAQEGINIEAARQGLGALINPNVRPAGPDMVKSPTGKMVPTQVNLGDVDSRGKPLGPTTAQPSSTTPPVPARAPQLATPAPPIRELPNTGTVADQNDIDQYNQENPPAKETVVAAQPKKIKVGASLTGQDEEAGTPGTPTEDGTVAGQETTATAAANPETSDFSAKGKESINTLAKALRGVQAPAAPAVQRIASPNAPRPTGTIKGGELQALLMALNSIGGGPQRTLGK